MSHTPFRSGAATNMNRWWSLVPPVLVILGGVCLYRSPWPGILRSMVHRQHVMVFPRFETVGLPLLTVILWGAAIALSIRLSRAVHSDGDRR